MCHRCATLVDGRRLCAACWAAVGEGSPDEAGARSIRVPSAPLAVAAVVLLWLGAWLWLVQVLGRA